MGLGFRSDRSQHGSGSPVNDWDPTVMEEDVMLDLTGYSFVDAISGNNSKITIEAGETYIFYIANTNDELLTVVPYTDSTYMKFALVPNSSAAFKITASNSERLYSAYNFTISVWKKN